MLTIQSIILLTWTFVQFSSSYEIKHLPIGIEIYGINLKDNVSPQAVHHIINAVKEHSIVVFKDQGVVPAKRRREISEWFGEIAAPFQPHPETEYPGVFRISNDPKHGYLGAGNESWHIDGSFLEMPYSTSIYHIIKTPSKGNTVFASLTEMIEDLPADLREEWDTLYIGTDVKKTVGMKVDDEDKSACPSASPVHPLMYPHPLTGKQVLCFNMDLIKTFGRNPGTSDEVWTDAEETKRIKKSINEQIEKDNGKFIYSHKWQEGDVIITDNLAVAHMASAETQLPPSEVGLRMLHRTTVEGKYKPSKIQATEAQKT